MYRNEFKKIIVSLTEIDKNVCTKELTVVKKLKIFDENKLFEEYESNFLQYRSSYKLLFLHMA